MMQTSDVIKRYESEVGVQARARQQELIATRYVCCGEHKDEGHHEMCSKRPKPVEPDRHDGQVSLL